MKLSITLCTAEHLDELVELSRTTFIHAFKDQNNPDDFEEYLKGAFGRNTLAAELSNIHSSFYFVHCDAVLAGYYKLNFADAQTELQDPGSVEIERIYVQHDFQGRGIGQWMISRIMEIAEQKEMEYVWLGVWEKNADAIRFYQAHGFNKFCEHPYYVGQDKQTDWLMRADMITLRDKNPV